MLFSPASYHLIKNVSTNCLVVSCTIIYILNIWIIPLKNQIDVIRCHLEGEKKSSLFTEGSLVREKSLGDL